MEHGITIEIRALRRMTVGELRDKYREVFIEETRSYNKQYLVRRIAWQLQALDEGGLSEKALRRAEEFVDDIQAGGFSEVRWNSCSSPRRWAGHIGDFIHSTSRR